MTAKIADALRGVHDGGFCLRVSVAQSLACLVGAGVPLLVDPELSGHVRYGARHYPAWVFWAVPTLSALVLVVTFWLLAKSPQRRRIWVATPPSLLLSLPMFWGLRPEFPHEGLFGMLAVVTILTTIAVWVRYQPMRVAYLLDPRVLPQAKLARAREEVSFWRTGSLAAIGGYLALLVSWYNTVMVTNGSVTPVQGEQFVLGQAALVSIALQSAWFLFGVVVEMANKAREALQLLEVVPASQVDRSDFSDGEL